MPASSYAILSTPRTGSTMLCAALKRVPGAGQPMEHLNDRAVAACSPVLRENIRTLYFGTLKAQQHSAGSAFGTKMHFEQFAKYYGDSGRISPEGVALMRSFDRLILVTRRDRILQALSMLKARQTQLWASYEEKDSGSGDYRFPPEQAPLVTGLIYDFQLQENAWRALLARLGLGILEVVYEDLASNTLSTLARVHDWLGLPRDAVAVPPTVKLASPSALEAKAQYLRLIGA